MQNAIDTFLKREGQLRTKLLDSISTHFTDAERENDWVLRELFVQLFSVRKLTLSSSLNIIFWDILYGVGDPLQTSVANADFVIVLDNGERHLYLSFYYALVAILRTLVDPRLHQRTQTANGIPQHVLVAFLHRAGLRKYMIEVVLKNIEDSINVQQLYSGRHIGHVAYQELLDYNFRKEECFETPPPEVEYWNTAFETPVEESDIQVPTFPPRLPASSDSYLVASTNQALLLNTVYEILWEKCSPLASELASYCKNTGCSCGYSFTNMEFLMSLFYVILNETLDERTMAKRPVEFLFNSEMMAPIFEVMETLAGTVRSWLTNKPEGAIFNQRIKMKSDYVTHLHSGIEKHYPMLLPYTVYNPEYERTSKWNHYPTVEWPIPFLLDYLDLTFDCFESGARLRSFLAKKVRARFIAYRIDAFNSRLLLDSSMAVIRNKYEAIFPHLFEEFFAFCSGPYCFIVTTPAAMQGIRLLQLLHISTCTNVGFNNECYANIFVQYFTLQGQGPLQQRLATYCLVNYLAYILGGKSAKQMTADPLEDDPAYALYTVWLPRVLYLFSDMEESSQHVLAFLMLKRDHLLSVKIASDIECQLSMDIAENGSPDLKKLHRTLTSELKKTNKEHVKLSARRMVPLFVSLYDYILGHPTFSEVYKRELLSGFMFKKKKKPNPVKTTDVNQTVHQYLSICEEVYYMDFGEQAESIEKMNCYNLMEPYTPARIRELANLHMTLHLKTRPGDFVAPSLEMHVFNKAVAEAGTQTRAVNLIYPANNTRVEAHAILPLDSKLLFEEAFAIQNKKDDVAEGSWRKTTLHSEDDRHVANTKISLDLALKYNSDWGIGGVTRGTNYCNRENDEREYVKCIQEWQNLLPS